MGQVTYNIPQIDEKLADKADADTFDALSDSVEAHQDNQTSAHNVDNRLAAKMTKNAALNKKLLMASNTGEAVDSGVSIADGISSDMLRSPNGIITSGYLINDDFTYYLDMGGGSGVINDLDLTSVNGNPSFLGTPTLGSHKMRPASTVEMILPTLTVQGNPVSAGCTKIFGPALTGVDEVNGPPIEDPFYVHVSRNCNPMTRSTQIRADRYAVTLISELDYGGSLELEYISMFGGVGVAGAGPSWNGGVPLQDWRPKFTQVKDDVDATIYHQFIVNKPTNTESRGSGFTIHRGGSTAGQLLQLFDNHRGLFYSGNNTTYKIAALWGSAQANTFPKWDGYYMAIDTTNEAESTWHGLAILSKNGGNILYGEDYTNSKMVTLTATSLFLNHPGTADATYSTTQIAATDNFTIKSTSGNQAVNFRGQIFNFNDYGGGGGSTRNHCKFQVGGYFRILPGLVTTGDDGQASGDGTVSWNVGTGGVLFAKAIVGGVTHYCAIDPTVGGVWTHGTGGSVPTPAGTTLPSLSVTGNTTLGSGSATLTGMRSVLATYAFATVDSYTALDSTEITVTGAAAGDEVTVTPPHAVATSGTGLSFTGWVSSSNKVTIRASNTSADPVAPPSGSYRIVVRKFT